MSETFMQIATLISVGAVLVTGGIAYGKLDQKTSAAHLRLDRLVEEISQHIRHNEERHSKLEMRIAGELKEIGDSVKNIEIAIARFQSRNFP